MSDKKYTEEDIAEIEKRYRAEYDRMSSQHQQALKSLQDETEKAKQERQKYQHSNHERKVEETKEATKFALSASSVILILLSIVVLFMWGCPKYEVYKRTLVGQAELKQAEWNRQIKIQEANATKESANALAEAEIRRAKGVAEANKIIGTSLKNNEAYLRWLWINNMDNQKEVIYIPTEAGMPILEAGKR